MRIIEFGSGKGSLSLVAGLIWHPLSTSGSAQSKEISEFSKSGGTDLKVLRGDESRHVGLAKKSDGALAGQLSLAALIADDLASKGHRNVLAALEVPRDRDHYVFIMVRDGVVLADGDAVGTRDEIRVKLVGAVAYGGWDCIICPDEWGVLDAKEREFGSFLDESIAKNRKQWVLKEISLPWRKGVIMVIAAILLFGGSSVAWTAWQKKKSAAAEVLRLQQEEVARGQKSAPSEPPKPWPLMPFAGSFAKACSQAFRDAGISGANWTLDGVVCEGGQLTVKWTKGSESAWVSHLKIARPSVTIASDGMSASLAVPALAAPANDYTSSLPAIEGINLRGFQLASSLGVAVRMDAPITPPVPATLPGQIPNESAPAPAPSWLALPILILANVEPEVVASAFDYPGLRFTKIAYAFKAGAIQYQITGVQYVHP